MTARFLRTLAVNAGVAIGSLLVALVLAEITVRIVAPQQLILIRPDIWQPADSIGWLHRPNVQTDINTGERRVHIVTDREGFRVGRAGRTEARTRILLLGDSFIEALQVEYEQSVAGLLERQLSAQLAQPVAVRNAGIGGWDPNHYLIRARSLLARDTFDLVIVALYVENDVIDARRDYEPPRVPVERRHLRIPRHFAWRSFVNAVITPMSDVLEVRSHLFILVKNRLQSLRMRTGLTPAYLPPEFLRRKATLPGWALTADVCRELAAAAAARGTPTLFVLIPTPYQVEPEVFGEYIRGLGIDSSQVDLEQPSRRLDEEFQARGLWVIDALAGFREAASSGGGPLYGTVDPHLSPHGHQVLADLLEPIAAEMLGGSREPRAASRQPKAASPTTRSSRPTGS